MAYYIKCIFGLNRIHTQPANKKDIIILKNLLGNYDYLIGSGAVPAILQSMDMRLDLFFAYSIGIEYVNEENFSVYKNSKNPIARFITSKNVQLAS